MLHKVEIDLVPRSHGKVLVDGQEIRCNRLIIRARPGESPVVSLRIPVRELTVKLNGAEVRREEVKV